MSTRLISTAIVFSLLLFVPSAVAVAGPAVVNGDFSAGSGSTATGWTKSSSTFGRTTLAGGGPGGATDYYMLIDANGCPGSVAPSASQTVTDLVPGESYLVQFEFKRYASYGAGTPGTLGAFVDGTLVYTNAVVPSAWTADAFVFTATSTSHTLMFATERQYAGSGACEDTSYGIDNVSLTPSSAAPPVPELSTLMLVAGGFVATVGVVAMRRR